MSVLANLAELRHGEPIIVEGVVLLRLGAQLFAYENVCPHARQPLQRSDGRLIMQEGRYLVCAGHGASFEAATGLCVGGPCDGDKLTPVAMSIGADGAIRLSR